jgi:hypothetical protein
MLCEQLNMCASPVPMGLAPPFGDLSKRYPIENLAEAFAEGIVTGHPAMPRFTFEPREIGAPHRLARPLANPELPTGDRLGKCSAAIRPARVRSP